MMAPKDQDDFQPEGFDSENAVVSGAGPVGLVASLLLSKYRIRHKQADYIIQQKIPEGLPDTFAVLLRPDGYIAWLHVPD